MKWNERVLIIRGIDCICLEVSLYSYAPSQRSILSDSQQEQRPPRVASQGLIMTKVGSFDIANVPEQMKLNENFSSYRVC